MNLKPKKERTEEEILASFKNVTSADITAALSKNLDKWEAYQRECDLRQAKGWEQCHDMVIIAEAKPRSMVEPFEPPSEDLLRQLTTKEKKKTKYEKMLQEANYNG